MTPPCALTLLAAALAVFACGHDPKERYDGPPAKLAGLEIFLDVAPGLPADLMLEGCKRWEVAGASCLLRPHPSAISIVPLPCAPDKVAFMAGSRFWTEAESRMHISPPGCAWADADQLPVTAAHELGHWLGIGLQGAHLPPGHLMAAKTKDMARWVTAGDYAALP